MSKRNGRTARPRTSAKGTGGAGRPVMVLNVDSADGYFLADSPAPRKKREPGHGAAAGAIHELAGLGA